MKPAFLLLILLLIRPGAELVAQPQEVGQWRVHFPMNSTHSVALLDDHALAASDYGMIVYDRVNRSTYAYSLSDGLSNLGLTTIEACKDGRTILMGYEDGQIDLWTQTQTRIIADIPKSGQHLGKTQIHDFAVVNNKRAFAAAGFGVVEIDMELALIKGTYLLRLDGLTTQVNAIAAHGDTLWAATTEGLRKAYVHSPLYLPSSWVSVAAWQDSNLISVAAGPEGVCLATDSSNRAWRRSGSQWMGLDLGNQAQVVRRVRATGDATKPWAVVREYDIYLLDAQGLNPFVIASGYGGNDGYRPMDIAMGESQGDMIYWTANASVGLTFIDNPNYVKHRSLSGPPTAESFRVIAQPRGMDVLPGALDATWTGVYSNEGVYLFDHESWRLFDASYMANSKDIVSTLVDPSDTSHWFASSWGKGILEYRNGSLYKLWNKDNSSLLPAGGSGPADIRVGDMIYGNDGAIWMTNALSNRPLHRYDPLTETWIGYACGTLNGLNVKDLIQDVDDQFWLMTRISGLAAVKIENGVAQVRSLKSGNNSGNLPTNRVYSIALEDDGEVWIGTADGLVVCYTPYSAFTGGNIDAQHILVDDNGIVRKVLGNQAVTAIAVDGANRKWVGTADAGVFLLSPDGLETVAHYTKDNAPLPDNRIQSMAIDPITGEVFIATSRGLVSYRGTATAPSLDASNVQIFPNPIRPGYLGPMTIKGLTADSDIVVTNVAGQLISRGRATGGQFSWNGRSLDGGLAPSGIYLFWVSGPNGSKVTVAQGVIIR